LLSHAMSEPMQYGGELHEGKRGPARRRARLIRQSNSVAAAQLDAGKINAAARRENRQIVRTCYLTSRPPRPREFVNSIVSQNNQNRQRRYIT